MTATQTAPFGFPHNLLALMRRAGGIFGKAMLAVAIIFAAGVLALVTAIAGITLACVALLMRLLGNHQETTTLHEHADGQGITLEARKTARGWTVE